MSGGKFADALIFWVLTIFIGVIAVAFAATGSPIPLIVLFGVTWIGLMSYWAWRVGNRK